MSHEPTDIVCGDCRESLHAYLDGELAREESIAVGRHLEACADCFERSQLEEAFRRSILAAAGSAGRATPAALEDRIRKALDVEDERRAEIELAGGRAALRRPRAEPAWRTWSVRALIAAATFLIVVATWSTLNVPQAPGGAEPAAVLHPAFVKGHLVCLDCAMMEVGVPSSGLDAQLPAVTVPSADPAQHHRLHLRCDQGRLWELFPEAGAAEALSVHDNAGRPASIVGTAFPELGVIRVARLDLD
jgi:anti-sigma factor RsiW